MELILSFPRSKYVSLIKNILIVLAASVIIGLAAKTAIPLPFSPIPITFSLHAVIFFSVFLGMRGVLGTFCYLAQGMMGAPVFAGGIGAATLLGPTGGYLIGFVIVSITVAFLAKRLTEKTPLKVFAIMSLGTLLAYVFGVPYLALFVGAKNAILMGFIPFIPGALVKLGLTYGLLRKLQYFK